MIEVRVVCWIGIACFVGWALSHSGLFQIASLIGRW